MKKVFMLAAAVTFASAFAADIALAPPDKTGGKSLMQCLAERKTARTFAPRALAAKDLSNLLYAAAGINRPDGKRTIPTARNVQDLEVYAALPSGLYKYEPKSHKLEQLSSEDIRKSCGLQTKMHAGAPVVLIFVSNHGRMASIKPEHREFYSAEHAGHASQNVYLYAASAGMNTVVCGAVDKPKLERVMKLKKDHRVLFTQPVGYAK